MHLAAILFYLEWLACLFFPEHETIMRAADERSRRPICIYLQVHSVIDKRPVNLSIPSIHFPVTAVVSILHRISGLLLILAFGAFLYTLHFSLASPHDFEKVIAALQRPSCKFGIWIFLSALAYHSCAGIRHLIMDLGIGESLKGGVLGAKISLICSVVLILVAGVWVMSW